MTKGTTHTTAQNPMIEPASIINNIPGAKVYDLTKMTKHPPEPSTMAAKHPPETNFNQRDDSGKASARPEQRQSIRQ